MNIWESFKLFVTLLKVQEKLCTSNGKLRVARGPLWVMITWKLFSNVAKPMTQIPDSSASSSSLNRPAAASGRRSNDPSPRRERLTLPPSHVHLNVLGLQPCLFFGHLLCPSYNVSRWSPHSKSNKIFMCIHFTSVWVSWFYLFLTSQSPKLPRRKIRRGTQNLANNYEFKTSWRPVIWAHVPHKSPSLKRILAVALTWQAILLYVK